MEVDTFLWQRLSRWNEIVQKTVMPLYVKETGLFKSYHDSDNAWIRDNCYGNFLLYFMMTGFNNHLQTKECIEYKEMYKNTLIVNAKAIIRCIKSQSAKLPLFMRDPTPKHAIHAVYNSANCKEIYSDDEYGHLQIDSVSLFLILISRLFISEIRIIDNMDDFNLIQNLIFYIERAFEISDYGIWERGDKLNQGMPELNTSSIGMAMVALKYLKHSKLSLVQKGRKFKPFINPDNSALLKIFLETVLPRESKSKEIDASLLMLLGFPSFAIQDEYDIEEYTDLITSRLLGKYGCKRFLRDGYKAPTEEKNRLYYNFDELAMFEKVESEWPMFLSNLYLNSNIAQHTIKSLTYIDQLNSLTVLNDEKYDILPYLYYVDAKCVKSEKQSLKKSKRIPITNSASLWSQSMYVLANLLKDNLITIKDIYPSKFRKKQIAADGNNPVQFFIVAENEFLKDVLDSYGFVSELQDEIDSFKILPMSMLSSVYEPFGVCENQGLSGRKNHYLGALCCSMFYEIEGSLYYFSNQVQDKTEYYVYNDPAFINDLIKYTIAYLMNNWMEKKPPAIMYYVYDFMLDKSDPNKLNTNILSLLRQLCSGIVQGNRVSIMKSREIIISSHIVKISEMSYDSRLLAEKNPFRISSMIDINSDADSIRSSIHQITRSSISISDNDVYEAIKDNDWANSLEGGMKACCHASDMNDNESSIIKRAADLYNEFSIENVSCKKADILYRLIKLIKVNDLQWDLICNKTECDVIEEMVENAIHDKNFLVLRYFNITLGSKAHLLQFSLSYILAKQKILTIGLSGNEYQITDPIPLKKLMKLINISTGKHKLINSLTEEFIIYLCQFFFEFNDYDVQNMMPNVYKFLHNTFNIKIGALIQVCLFQIQVSFSLSPDDAARALAKMTPSSVKNLLFAILSCSFQNYNNFEEGEISDTFQSESFCEFGSLRPSIHLTSETNLFDTEFSDKNKKLPLWFWRRKIDGILARVPCNFYASLWHTLCLLKSITIGNTKLDNILTKSMTSNELKFTIIAEEALLNLQCDEFRQLAIEILCAVNYLTQMIVKSYVEKLYKLSTIDVDVVTIANNAQDSYFEYKEKTRTPLYQKDKKLEEELISDLNDTHNFEKSINSSHYGITKKFFSLAPSGSAGSTLFIVKSLLKLFFE